MIWITTAVLLSLTAVPLPTLNCPAWEVSVVDGRGNPIEGITVRLTYRNYSAEYQSHEIDAVTDKTGRASFPAKELYASLGRRVIGTAALLQTGVHASFGPHANVFAFGGGLQGYDVDQRAHILIEWTGKPSHMQSHITAQ